MTFSQFNENYKMGATIQSLNQDYTKARKFSHYFLTSKDCEGSIIPFLRLDDGNFGVKNGSFLKTSLILPSGQSLRF